MSCPASKLRGLTLSGDWTADKELTGLSDTGGNFSYGYQVTHKDGRKAFLKALDYSRALRSPDPPKALQALTATYLFERNILQTCKSRRMDRVVQSIHSGYVVVDHTDLGRVDFPKRLSCMSESECGAVNGEGARRQDGVCEHGRECTVRRIHRLLV